MLLVQLRISEPGLTLYLSHCTLLDCYFTFPSTTFEGNKYSKLDIVNYLGKNFNKVVSIQCNQLT